MNGKKKIIAIGDNVCDKILSRNKMYPGGQCVNTCVYSVMNGVEAAYIGKFGSDQVALCVQQALKVHQVDYSRCRYFEGENGFACVDLVEGDRVFVGSNRGGVAKEHSYDFGREDFRYIRGFDLIYTDLNCYIEDELPELAATKIPIAFDFSNRWTQDYLERVCPYVKIAVLSCAHLNHEARIQEMKKVQSLGVPVVLGTAGEEGSWLLYKDAFYFCEICRVEEIKDTMGAGDAYFAAFCCYLLKNCGSDVLSFEDEKQMMPVLQEAMRAGAQFSAQIVCMEGAFGHGQPISGRIIRRNA